MFAFDDVLRAARAGAEESASLGKPMALAILDAGGRTLLVHRLDGVHAAATDVALAKARASALFARPSAALEELVGSDDRRTLMLLSSVVDGVLPIEGGVAVLADGDGPPAQRLVAAVGASGGTPAEDGRVADVVAGALRASNG